VTGALRSARPRPAREITIPDGPAGRGGRVIVLLICSSSLFITYLDSTILNVALPTLQVDLHASLAGLQWVADAYLLVVASLLMLTGSTADRLGRKRLFLIGLTGFGVGSLLCSVAPNTGSSSCSAGSSSSSGLRPGDRRGRLPHHHRPRPGNRPRRRRSVRIGAKPPGVRTGVPQYGKGPSRQSEVASRLADEG
jgi:hypothetical protein